MAAPTDLATTQPCSICGRPLKAAKSLARGYGERCAPATATAPAHDLTRAAGTSRVHGPVDAPPAQALTAAQVLHPAANQLTDPGKELPRRLITTFVPVDLPSSDGPDAEHVIGVGYHQESRRLELQLRRPDHVLAYRNVGPDVHHDLLVLGGGVASQDWQRANAYWTPALIRARPAYQYQNATQAAAAGIRRRCSTCGQFTGTEHLCLGRRRGHMKPSVIRTGNAQSISLTSPTGSGPEPILLRSYPLAQIADELAAAPRGEVEIPFRAIVPPDTSNPHSEEVSDIGECRPEGRLLISLSGDDLSVTPAEVSCCSSYRRYLDCRHIREVAAGIRNAMREELPGRRKSFATELAQAIDDQPGPEQPEDISTFRYTDDPARFALDVQEALDRDRGDIVPFLAGGDQPAMYGYGATRRFGVELEYTVVDPYPTPWGDDPLDEDLDEAQWQDEDVEEFGEFEDTVYKADGTEVTVTRHGWHSDSRNVLVLNDDSDPSMTYVVTARIAAALCRAGLTPDATINSHGDTESYGYGDNPWGEWTVEEDPTVDGEVISPILTDTDTGWRSLQTACQIISRGGGGGSSDTGSHVTVSAPDFINSPGKINRLIRTLRRFDADLDVMAAAGHERNNNENQGYARSFPAPPPVGFHNVSEVCEQFDRYRTVNLMHIPTSDDADACDAARIEFRLWDGSIEPGRIQAQIKLSAALLDHVSAGSDVFADGPPGRSRAADLPHPRYDSEGFTKETSEIRTLIDALFHRDCDKQQAAALWAAGASSRHAW